MSWGCRAGEGCAGATPSSGVGELGGARASGQLPGAGDPGRQGEGWGLEGSASCLLTCSVGACACEGCGHGECQATSAIPKAGWML